MFIFLINVFLIFDKCIFIFLINVLFAALHFLSEISSIYACVYSGNVDNFRLLFFFSPLPSTAYHSQAFVWGSITANRHNHFNPDQQPTEPDAMYQELDL